MFGKLTLVVYIVFIVTKIQTERTLKMKNNSVLTVEEIASHLKVSTKTIYRLIERKELPAIRVSRMYRINEKDFESWLDEKKNA